MESKSRLYVDKHKRGYIIISSLLLYFVFNCISYDRRIYIPFFIRTYYITASTVIMIILKQIKKYNEKNMYNLTTKFFWIIIVISMLCFFMNLSGNILKYALIYIECSSDIILIYQLFMSYIISEYILNKRYSSKSSYIILILTMGIILITCYYKWYFISMRILQIIIKMYLIKKLFVNLINLEENDKYKFLIFKICIIFSIIVEVMNLYRNVHYGVYTYSLINEMINLIIFRLVHSYLFLNLIKEPYNILSKSLEEENNDLDKLNLEIILKNSQLENSIAILNEENNIMKKLFRFMPNPIIILNEDNDRIIYVNAKFKEFCGIEKSRHLINKNINNYLKIVNESDSEQDFNAIFELGSKKKYVYVGRINCYAEENTRVLVLVDNTSKVEAEQIKRQIEKKKHEEKMRTQFLSSISHDLKTPVNVIYSANQVEKIYIENNNKKNLEKYNTVCKHNCTSLIELTNNLIDASKINSQYLSVNLETHNLVDIIEENVMALVDYVKWNNVDLVFDTNIEEYNMLLDPEFMKRIILNLISNAVKFTSDGGKIDVRVSKGADTIEISVEDTGAGMDDDFIDIAFNRYTVDNSKNVTKNIGTGIGLFVVKEMVEKQKGEICIEKGRKTGAKINIFFKLDEKIS